MGETPATRPSLLIRLRDSRDQDAWVQFVEIYGPLIHRLARQNGFQDSDAEDLTQEVFRTVSAAVEKWDPDPARGSFRGWLFRVARNLMIDFLARERRHPRAKGDTEVQLSILEQVAAPAEDTERFDREYKRRLFGWAIATIRGEFSEQTWRAFWQTGVEGKRARDVAAALGMTIAAVYRCKSRVMARLREKIEEAEGRTEAPGSDPDPRVHDPPV